MYRRQFLVGVSAVAIAGCSNAGDSGDGTTPAQDTPSATPTPTPTETPTPEPTPEPTEMPTPTPTPPDIQNVNPIYRWESYGDVLENVVSGIGQGATLTVGGRYQVWVHSGTVDVTTQARAFNRNNERIGIESSTIDQVTSGDGPAPYESAVLLDTSGWPRGEITGDYIVRDNVLKKASQAGEWSVNVVEPLQAGEVSLAEYNGPTSVRVGESFDYEIVLRNTGGRDSSVVSSISTRTDGGQWYQTAERDYTIPAGESVGFTAAGVSFSTPGEHEFRLDTIEVTWSISAEE